MRPEIVKINSEKPETSLVRYAADQIRGEGATLQFFSNRQYRNPMVVRVAGYGYQKGFGGHFHNDDSIATIRDIHQDHVMATACDAQRVFVTAILKIADQEHHRSPPHNAAVQARPWSPAGARKTSAHPSP